MQARRALAFLTVLVISFVSLQASPASAASPGEFVSSINNLRGSQGLSGLAVDGRLSSVAQDWANQMAAAGKISHRPNLAGSVNGGWTKLGENVGVGGSVGSIFNALVASPGHYRNMVDGSFNSVGVGVAVGADGRIYTAHNFATFSGAAAAKAPAAKAPAKAPAKPATTKAPAAKAAAPAKAARRSPVTTSAPAPPVAEPAPAPAPAPAPEPAPEPVAPKPTPSSRIVQSLAEVGGIATQG